jgi:hypothetical protein
VTGSFGDRWQSAKDVEWQSQLDAERALADDAADLFDEVVDEWDHSPEWFAKRSQWLARYREARGR